MGTGTNNRPAVPNRSATSQHGGLFREKKGWTVTIRKSSTYEEKTRRSIKDIFNQINCILNQIECFLSKPFEETFTFFVLFTGFGAFT